MWPSPLRPDPSCECVSLWVCVSVCVGIRIGVYVCVGVCWMLCVSWWEWVCFCVSVCLGVDRCSFVWAYVSNCLCIYRVIKNLCAPSWAKYGQALVNLTISSSKTICSKMATPNFGTWKLFELLQLWFPQNEVLYGKGRNFRDFKPPSFPFSAIVRELDMKNDKWAHSERLNDYPRCLNKDFLNFVKHSCSDP